METSQLIYSANHLIGFCVMATLAFIELTWERKVFRNFGKVVISFEINLSGLQLQH